MSRVDQNHRPIRHYPHPESVDVLGYSWTDAAYTKLVLRWHELRICGGNSPATRRLRARLDRATEYLESRLQRAGR